MLNFAEREVHRQAIFLLTLIASVTLYQIRIDKSHLTLLTGVWRYLLGANDYMTLHKDNVIMVVEQQIDDIEKIISVELIMFWSCRDSRFVALTYMANILMKSRMRKHRSQCPVRKLC